MRDAVPFPCDDGDRRKMVRRHADRGPRLVPAVRDVAGDAARARPCRRLAKAARALDFALFHADDDRRATEEGWAAVRNLLLAVEMCRAAGVPADEMRTRLAAVFVDALGDSER